MQQFQISLKNEKVKQYDRIALFITIINLSLFIYVAFAVTNKQDRIAAIAGAALVLIALSIDYFLSSIKNNKDNPYKLVAIYAISMVWWKIDFWWIGVLCFAIGTLYFASKRILLVSISKEKIIDSLPKITKQRELISEKFYEYSDFCGQQLNKCVYPNLHTFSTQTEMEKFLRTLPCLLPVEAAGMPCLCPKMNGLNYLKAVHYMNYLAAGELVLM